MNKDSFLDTNIIINYINFDERFSKDIVRKCYDYIINKKAKFILCYIGIKELYNVMNKKSRIHKAVLNMKDDENFDLNKLLHPKEIPFAKKLYAQFKIMSKEKLLEEFTKEQEIFEIKIETFLKFKVDERVIPLEQIDNSLVNKIHNIIPNHADCKILASAIQFRETRAIFLFVTADGKDLNPNGYEDLKEHFEINYSKEKYKFPELLNLMFAN